MEKWSNIKLFKYGDRKSEWQKNVLSEEVFIQFSQDGFWSYIYTTTDFNI